MKKRNKIITSISAISILGANSLSMIHPDTTSIDSIKKESLNTTISEPYLVNAKTSTISMKTTENLNVRSGAGTKYKKIGLLKKGQKINITSISNNWAKFTYNGKTAYVSAKYLSKVSSNTQNNNSTQISKKMIVNTSALNVRSGAGTKYKKIGILKRGQKITITSISGSWAKFIYNNKTAYVSTKYLKESSSSSNNSNSSSSNSNQTSKQTMKTTNNLNVRKGAGTNYEVKKLMLFHLQMVGVK